MTLDLHPEDLIDKAACGSIAGDERRRLDAHLALCEVCRFELSARDAFRAEEADMSETDLDALVARALGSPEAQRAAASNDAHLVPVVPVVPRVTHDLSESSANALALANVRLTSKRRVPKQAMWLVAAAVALVSVQALAGKWNVLRMFASSPAPVVSVAMESEKEAPKPTAHSGKHHANDANNANGSIDTETDDGTSLQDAPQPTQAPPLVEAPVQVAASPVTSGAAAAPVANVPSGQITLRTSSTSSSIAPTSSAGAHVANANPAAYVPLDTIAALFERASRDRARGDHAAARADYAELFQRFPRSPEATLARATYGRMLLDDGDAEGALVQLDTYLAEGDSALREQAMAARATALGREGRFNLEVQAWERLLHEFPSSLYATRAHERISEVGAR